MSAVSNRKEIGLTDFNKVKQALFRARVFRLFGEGEGVAMQPSIDAESIMTALDRTIVDLLVDQSGLSLKPDIVTQLLYDGDADKRKYVASLIAEGLQKYMRPVEGRVSELS